MQVVAICLNSDHTSFDTNAAPYKLRGFTFQVPIALDIVQYQILSPQETKVE